MKAVEIYGRKGCSACDGARKKFNTFIKKWDLKEKVIVKYFDMDTEEGVENGAINGIVKIPTIVIVDTDRNKEITRWEGKSPISKEFENIIKENL